MNVGIGVMARSPGSAGKTRLAPHVSPSRLRALRSALLSDTLRTTAAGGAVAVRPVVFVTPGDACGEVAALCEAAVDCVPQPEGDLGCRMAAALSHLLQTLKYDAAILVGSDIPLLTSDHLDEARELLAAAGGVVIGPADDGGYFLIGMTKPHPELFAGIDWGTASVLTDTLRAADRLGIEARLVRAAYDVDTIEDLQRLERDLQTAPANLAQDVRSWFKMFLNARP